MTVTSQTYRSGPYDGDGISVAFPVAFFFLNASHLAVYRTDNDGNDARLTLGRDYAVIGAGDPNGGTLTMATAPAAGQKITIIRNVPLTQEVDYPEGGRFPALTHERALDKLTMIVQQLREAVGRAVLLAASSQIVDVTIPDPAAGLPIGWAPDGSGRLVNLTALGGWRSDWASGADYASGDIVKDAATGDLYAVTRTHRSDATIAADVAAGKLVLAINVAEIKALHDQAQASARAAAERATACAGFAGAAQTDADSAETSAASAAHEARAASVAATHAEAWAESAGEPGGSGTKSAKTHAAAAAASAAAAARAQGRLDVSGDLLPPADEAAALGSDARRFSALHAMTIVGAPPHFHVREEQPATTSGGSFIAGAWRTRRLNTIVSNTITGARLSANTITLPAGRYSFNARAPAFNVKVHQIRLWNLTDDEVLLSGIQNYTNANSNVQNLSCLNQRAEISGIKTIQFQHRCGYSKTSSGFGVRGAFQTGIFAEVIIEKIGEVA